MVQADPHFARSDILRSFNHSQVYLILGDTIITIGLLAGFFSLLRRRLDPLLLWFALFAVLYGLRLELEYQLLWDLGLHPAVLGHISLAIDYLVPIPAFFFFRQVDLFKGNGRALATIVWPIALCCALAALVLGSSDALRIINNVFILAALFAVALLLFRHRGGPPDYILVRRGLLIFIACAFFDNITGIWGHFYNIEPFSFLVLLGYLGIVAGRRTLAKEQQLTVLQKELDIAQQIQLSILPASLPVSQSFQVAARYLPMTSIAGDFYDFLVPTDSEIGLLIADVSGHGIPAALIASMVKLAATIQSASIAFPSNLLLGMNSALLGNTQRQYVTAAYVYINASSQELRYSGAGHPPMLLLRDGVLTEIAENGIPLALFADASYETVTLPMQAGDRLVLYTDGLLEATNAHDEEFGSARLHNLIRETSDQPLADAADKIMLKIQQWSAAQTDDLTVLICDYKA